MNISLDLTPRFFDEHVYLSEANWSSKKSFMSLFLDRALIGKCKKN